MPRYSIAGQKYRSLQGIDWWAGLAVDGGNEAVVGRESQVSNQPQPHYGQDSTGLHIMVLTGAVK